MAKGKPIPYNQIVFSIAKLKMAGFFSIDTKNTATKIDSKKNRVTILFLKNFK
jgi:hypothetical protein